MAVNSFNAQNPPVTTKGDVFTFSTIPTRLGVGANNTVLTADSSTSTGLKWATTSSGGMTLLSTTTLSGTTTTISNISQDYVDLVLYITNVNGGTDGAFNINPNESASIVTGLSLDNSSGTFVNDPYNNQSIHTYFSWDAGNTNNAIMLRIYNYASIVNYKPFFMTGYYVNTSAVGVGFNTTGGIKTNSAISSFSFTGIGSVTGGTVKIYGVK